MISVMFEEISLIDSIIKKRFKHFLNSQFNIRISNLNNNNNNDKGEDENKQKKNSNKKKKFGIKNYIIIISRY